LKKFFEKNHCDLGIVIMIEPGALEWNSIILISSLKMFCLDSFKIYVYCRRDRIHALQETTKVFLHKNDIVVNPISNHYVDGYPQGNKMIACAQSREEQWTLFLDTDTVLTRPIRFLDVAIPGCVSATPADMKTWTQKPEDWRAIYEFFGLSFPESRVILRNGEIWLPYFNGGFILFDKTGLADNWVKVADKIDEAEFIANKRPWLDQIALPITIFHCTNGYNSLDPKWNFGSVVGTPMNSETILVHYHGVDGAKRSHSNKIINQILSESTEFQNISQLRDFFAKSINFNKAKNTIKWED
jgi:hypothetical protein